MKPIVSIIFIKIITELTIMNVRWNLFLKFSDLFFIKNEYMNESNGINEIERIHVSESKSKFLIIERRKT